MKIKNKVIFLDVDGVINHYGSKSFCLVDDIKYRGIDTSLVKILKHIVDKTDASIVLTSTWKDFFTIGTYKQQHKHGQYLSNKLRKQGLYIADKTEDRKWAERGLGIQHWLDEHPNVTNWVILDDETFDYRDLKETCFDHFILTDEMVGLNDWQAGMAIKILNGEAQGPVPYYKEECKPE